MQTHQEITPSAEKRLVTPGELATAAVWLVFYVVIFADRRSRGSPRSARSSRFFLDRQELSPDYELNRAILAAIAKDGFYIMHAAIQVLPIAAAHDRKKSTERLPSS